MLDALRDLAEREQLVQEPGFQKIRIDWLIAIDRNGTLLGFQTTKSTDGRGKAVSKTFLAPQRSGRTVKVQAEHLVDKREYVFGGEDERSRKAAAAFRDDIASIAAFTGDDAIAAIGRFLRRWDDGEFRDRLPADLSDQDTFGFVIEPEHAYLFDPTRPSVRDYVRSLASTEGKRIRECLVCGRPAPIERLHRDIKGVPGTTRAKLSSVNSPAFESYGFTQGFNAPVCESCAESYAAALNCLLDPRASYRRNVRLDASSGVVFWSSSSFDDIFSSMLEGNPDAVAALYGSPWKGRPVRTESADRFYACVLGSAQGRVVVREWIEESLSRAIENLRRYFEDIEIVRRDGARPPALNFLIRELAPLKSSEKTIPPHLEAGIVRAVFTGSPFPRTVIETVIRRCRSDGNISWPRMALLRATLRRLPNSPWKEVPSAMDPTNANAAYLCGRLFAVLERLQREAQGETNVTIADRYYGSASSAPASIFGALMRLHVHHLAKCKRPEFFRRLIGEICKILPQELPKTLSLTEQAVFTIGYYQQRQALFER